MERKVTTVKRSLGILVVLLSAFLVGVSSAWGATPVLPAGGSDFTDDGFTPAQRQAIYGSGPETFGNVDRDIVIVHRSELIVFFGFYRACMMTEPGWDLYERSFNWANGFKNPPDTKVWLATYNGSLDPKHSAEKDGIAVYNYLINDMGIPADNIHVAHQTSIETGDFTGYDIVLYVNTYPRNATNVLNQNKPFVTTSAGETDELGIGTGANTMHEFRDNAFVLNNAHHITQPYPLGEITFQEGMWMDASTRADAGVVLIAADDRTPSCSGNERLKAKCKTGGKLKAKVRKGLPNAVITIGLDTGEMIQANVNGKGKAKVKFKGVASGERTVTIMECGVEKKTVCP